MKNLLTLLVVALCTVTHAQKGLMFPEIIGMDLNNKQVNIPPNNGKYSVVAIAFGRDAEDALRKWMQPLYETFVKKEEAAGGMSPAEVNDANFYFVPLIAGFKKVVEDFKKETDKEFWKYVIDSERTDVKANQKKLGLKDSDIPYFFVLDKSGKIVEVQSGTYNATKLDKLEDAIE
jgi:hypothetical protein